MKRFMAVAMVLLVASAALAGCSGGNKKKSTGEDLPDEISRSDVDRLERLVTDPFPRQFSFPGQVVLPPVRTYFNGTVTPGQGAGLEVPDDDGVMDAGGTVLVHDLSDQVPNGQPVELRLKLKWWGNPGSSADLDLYVNVPGTRDSYSPNRYDESLNWNIITKFRVVNAVRVDGQPFEVGVQVSNGKNIHPDGIKYSIAVDLHYAAGVFAPGVPYAIQVPEGATSLIFESEPLVGDEHITSEYLVIDPSDGLVRHILHNDIAMETMQVPIRNAGEYVLFAHSMHGGFLRVEADVPIPSNTARILPMTVTETVIAADVLAEPGTQGTGGKAGTFDVSGTFPLDVFGFIRPSGTTPVGSSGNVALNISSPAGPVHGVEATAYSDGATGRVGMRQATFVERDNLAVGTYSFTLNANGGAGLKAGFAVVTYGR
jgi:predicted small secreted protein